MRELKFQFPTLRPPERRKAQRATTHETLFLRYESPVHLTRGIAEGKDISSTGLRFACTVNYPKGTPLDLTFQFSLQYPRKPFLQVRGYVIRSYRKPLQTRYRIACAFDHLDATAHEEIQAFVDWLKERNARYLYR